MARPFRHRPPELAAGSVLRHDVQAALAGRFDRRVTVLVGGAGFGKTTALAQAFEENRLRSLGTDRWLGCDVDDTDPWHFVRGLATALDLDDALSPAEFVDRVVEAIGGVSPGSVCIVLDDVHFLGDESAAIVDDLVDRLPSNGHLLLSGRRLPTVSLSRLELIGECVVVDEPSLAFDEQQVAEVLGEPASTTAGRFGGWPALVQLAKSGRADRFVDEEVLRSLDDSEVEVLRTLAVLGECDTETLGRLTGHVAGPIVEALPLVHHRGSRWGAHDLWSDLLAPIDPGFVDSTRRGAATIHLEQGAATSAVDVLVPLRTDADDPLVGRALRAALVTAHQPHPPTLRRWQAAWRDAAQQPGAHPAHLLLTGLVLRLDNPGDEVCHETLDRAAQGFLEVDDAPAAVTALSALCFAYHVRRDVDGLQRTFARLTTLAADGVVAAQPFPLLGAGLIATAQGDASAVLGCTDQLFELHLDDEVRAISLWLRAYALTNLGHDAVAPARECYEMGLPLPGMGMMYNNARLHAGLIAEIRDDPIVPMEGERDRFLMATYDTVVSAVLGDFDEANRHLEIVETSGGDASQWQTVGSIAIPRAVVAAMECRDDDARAILRDFTARTPREGSGGFYYTASIGLLYPLLPELRDWFHELNAAGRLGPYHARDLALAAALTSLIEDDDLDAIAAVELPDRVSQCFGSLGIRNVPLLLAACTSLDRPETPEFVVDAIELLGERARESFRALLDWPLDAVAAGARTILESMPVPPTERLSVSLFGGTELHRDGVVVDHPDWRRERVRALFTYLVLNPSATRETVIASIWPDADAASGRRSLRTTLNMLHSVLEPSRRGGDAPFFIRSIGQRFQLVLGSMEVDVDRFESAADLAVSLDEGGTPSQSIDHYLDAVSHYRGDLLSDSYDDWVVFARDRLRAKYVATGIRAAELLIMTGRPDEAIDIAVRMLTVEPWSEPAHRVLIAAHLERGDVASARRCLETCDRALDDIGGAAEPETDELRRRLARR